LHQRKACPFFDGGIDTARQGEEGKVLKVSRVKGASGRGRDEMRSTFFLKEVERVKMAAKSRSSGEGPQKVGGGKKPKGGKLEIFILEVF